MGIKADFEPCVLWFTGFSGSGKSTLSRAVFQVLRDQGRSVEHLDGDSIREILPETGFTREERIRHLRWAGFLASRLERHGVTVIASFVSPYRESRDFVRGLCQRFLEIHVCTPLDVCEKRDAKGLYAKARRGEIADFTGISAPYENPLSPELSLDTSGAPVQESVRKVLERLGGGSWST